jgi:asparagine synthase (glutamine-hydrolysing)
MCGIAGDFDLHGRPPDEAALQRMVATVSHRGPDGSRIEVSNPVALGHARLRVIDLSPQADQPMWNDGRTVGLVFNGEIYNFQELRSELEEKGIRFKTRGDTEVILKLYETLGEAAIPRLDGMFALAIWDQPQGRLLLARDRAGKKPLFFVRDGRRFAFASEIKGLHAHPDIERAPNLDRLPFYLTYGYVPAPETFYRGVRVLPPATTLSVDRNGKLTFRRYWTPPYLANGTGSKRDAVGRLRELMENAVIKRLISDVPLGAFLSGGLDSTVVVGLMSRVSNRPVRTFSIGFENHPDYDETEYAEEVARAFGTEHTTFRVRPPDAELLETLVHHHDGPFGDSSAIPTYIVSRLAREHVTVILNGDGGDEIFAGYERLAAAAITERIPHCVKAAGAGIGRLLPEPSNWSNPLRRVKRLLEAVDLPLDEKIRLWCSFFPDATRSLLSVEDPDDVDREIAGHFQAFLSEASAGTPLAKLLHLNFCTYLPEDLLVKMDRSTMAHGLEARSPFLDTELVQFAAQLPDRFKLRGLKTKYILRQAFRDLFPPSIVNRGKMGFGVPLGAWFRGPMRTYVLEHLGNKKSRIFDYLQPDAVGELLEQHMSGRRDLGQQLFCLITLEIWLRTL